MNLNLAIMKRTIEKLADMAEPVMDGAYRNSEETKGKTNADARAATEVTDALSQLHTGRGLRENVDYLKNPYGAAGDAADALSQISTGQSLKENIDNMHLGDNGLVRAMLNLRGIHPDTGMPR